jgi:hypothetical protein
MLVAEAVLPEDGRLQVQVVKVAVVLVRQLEVKTEQQTVAAVAAAVKEMTKTIIQEHLVNLVVQEYVSMAVLAVKVL